MVVIYIFLLCYEVLLPWNFHSPGFDVRAPPQDPPNMKKSIFFHILGLNFKISYQIASLFDMHIVMGERIAGKQDRHSLLIEHPLRDPQIAQNIHIIFLHFGSYMKNWFSNCFPLLYICLHCDEVCICWHFGAPATPGFYVRAQHDPEKNDFFFIFFILTQKVLIILLLYWTCKLLLKRVDVNQDGPSLIIEPPPPPPRAPK